MQKCHCLALPQRVVVVLVLIETGIPDGAVEASSDAKPTPESQQERGNSCVARVFYSVDSANRHEGYSRANGPIFSSDLLVEDQGNEPWTCRVLAIGKFVAPNCMHTNR
jgi:hypothetical protein